MATTEAAREELLRRIAEIDASAAEAEAEHERVRFEVRRLTSALLHYGRHSEWCLAVEGEVATAPCGCGWETVREAVRQGEEEGA